MQSNINMINDIVIDNRESPTTIVDVANVQLNEAVTIHSSFVQSKPAAVSTITVLPDELNNLTAEDLKNVVLQPCKDANGKECETAFSLYGYGLAALTCLQIRKVCSMLGVGGYKSQKKGNIRILIAEEMKKVASAKGSFGTVNNHTLLKHNTLLRLINALFHKDNYEDFAAMNQKKTRQELDKGGAGNNKIFLSSLSDYINDNINNDRIGTILLFADDDDFGGRLRIDGEKYDLNNYEQQNYEKVGASVKELIKKWELVEKNITKSGSHQSDPFLYCGQGGFPLYYFYFMVNNNNAEDSLKPKLSSYLREDVFFDSGAKDNNNNKKKSTNKKSKVDDSTTAIIEEHFVAFRTSSEQRMDLFMKEQKQNNVTNLIHNKTIELSDIDVSFNANIDIVEDDSQPERKRKRAQKKLIELKERESTIKKMIRELDPGNPIGYTNNNEDDASDYEPNHINVE